jgi:hypothetical protein
MGDPWSTLVVEKYISFSTLYIFPAIGTLVALWVEQTTNPNREGKKMRTDGQTIRGNEMDMAGVKAWAKRTFTKEKISLAIARLVVAGYLGIALAQLLQTY